MSKKSVLRIEFDNAAATGYVQTARRRQLDRSNAA
jgi:hypothetical protein